MSIFPFKIIQKAPHKDKNIPINWIDVVLVLKIKKEKKIIRTGAIDVINEELITKVVLREMYVNELKTVIPRIERKINKKIFLKNISKLLSISFEVKGNKITKANNHLKKLSLKGLKSLLKANFPIKKLPDQNKEDRVNSKKAKNIFFCITSIYQSRSSRRMYLSDYLHFLEFVYKIDLLFL